MILHRCRLPAVALALALAPAGLLLVGCGGGHHRSARPPGSALWLGAEAPAPTAQDLSHLASVGVGEVFVEGPELVWRDGHPHVEGRPTFRPPRRTPATLVVRGTWKEGEVDAGRAAITLGQDLRRLELESQTQSLVPVGVHFDLDLGSGDAGLESFAAVLGRLGARQGEDLFLSTTVDRRRLTGDSEGELSEGVEALARRADFLVAFLYGQRPDEEEDPSAWDLEAVTRGLGRLDALGCPYLLGVVTLGRALRLNGSGGVEASTTEGHLRDLVENPALALQRGFTLEGIDRQDYSFAAERATSFGPWRLARGEGVKVERLAPFHIHRLKERLAGASLEHLLGLVYYRPPGPGEGFSLSLANLADALSPEPREPRVVARLEGHERGGATVVRVEVANVGQQPTELATIESNYVELHTRRGSFGSVDRGSFARYDALDAATGRRSLRPDSIRLYTPFLEAGEAVGSGDLVLRGGGLEDLEVGGRFLLPDGNTVEVERAAARQESGGSGRQEGGR